MLFFYTWLFYINRCLYLFEIGDVFFSLFHSRKESCKRPIQNIFDCDEKHFVCLLSKTQLGIYGMNLNIAVQIFDAI